MHRLFVAIELPDDIKAALGRLQNGVPGARWVEADKLHLTLRFIGDVDGAQAEDIAEALAGVDAVGFDLVLADAGLFPLRGPPKVVWAGVRQTDALIQLKQKVDNALLGAGCPPDGRRYAPHVTLARLKTTPRDKAADFVAHTAPLVGGRFSVAGFALVQSFLASAGAIHRVEATYPLRAI